MSIVGERARRFLWEFVADAALDRPGGVDVAILTDPRGSVLPDPQPTAGHWGAGDGEPQPLKGQP